MTCRRSTRCGSCVSEGIEGLLVCSASYEEDALVEISDVILDGPAGVAGWLADLADALDG